MYNTLISVSSVELKLSALGEMLTKLQITNLINAFMLTYLSLKILKHLLWGMSLYQIPLRCRLVRAGIL